MHDTTDDTGFTIVEILVVGTVVAVLLGGTTLALGNLGRQIWTRTEPRLTALTDAQRALDRVSEDLRTASSASVNDTPPNRCRANLLSFRQVDQGGMNNRVRYNLSGTGGVLTRDFDALDDGAGIVTQTIVTGVTTFTPTCPPGGPAGVVGLTLTAQVTTPQGQATQRFDSNVLVRSP